MTDEERRVARNAAKEKYRRANRDKVNARRRATYARDKDKPLDPAIEAKRKEQRKAISAKWRLTNPEKAKESAKKWRIANPEKSNAIDKRCKVKRKDAIRAEQKRWRLANLERSIKISRSAGRRYYASHREECADRDVHTKLAKQLGVPRNQVPNELLGAKLAVAHVKRKVKELSK